MQYLVLQLVSEIIFGIQSMQDEMMDLSTEIQESLGRSYNVADDIDEEELMGGMVP